MRRQLIRRPQTVWDFMNEVNSIFDESLNSSFEHSSSTAMRVSTDIEEIDDGYLFSFDLPGVKSEDIKLDFSDGRLKISGERKRASRGKQQNGFERIEKSYGSFERTFQLPQNIDETKIKAHFENGQLEVMVPKAEIAKPKSIEIETGKGGLFSKLLGNKDESKDQH
ncbi:MAG: Hsp20/alpha crystallin family protein [Bdellovibrionales bacterium]|nr:Hsp20/alpha crystallin family protein [Bdellovibrionales bacterium]